MSVFKILSLNVGTFLGCHILLRSNSCRPRQCHILLLDCSNTICDNLSKVLATSALSFQKD
jgi:hypothetical protein